MSQPSPQRLVLQHSALMETVRSNHRGSIDSNGRGNQSEKAYTWGGGTPQHSQLGYAYRSRQAFSPHQSVSGSTREDASIPLPPILCDPAPCVGGSYIKTYDQSAPLPTCREYSSDTQTPYHADVHINIPIDLHTRSVDANMVFGCKEVPCSAL